MSEIYENKPLTEVDPEIAALIVEEQARQINCLEFIASEVRCARDARLSATHRSRRARGPALALRRTLRRTP